MNDNPPSDGLDSPPGSEVPDLWLVDRLMTGVDLPGGTPDRERVRMQRLVDALRAPGTAAELAARDTYLTAFDEVAAGGRSARPVVLGARAVAVAGVVVLAAATGAAAYTGTLPGPLQRVAHSTIGAPAADEGSDGSGGDQGDDPSGTPTESPTGSPTESPTGSPTESSSSSHGVGPDATGPAAFGLCNAWSHGGLSTTSVAYRNLASAAGGAASIQAYCATVVKSGHGASHSSGSPTSHHNTGTGNGGGHGSPTAHPSKTPAAKGSPTTHPGGH